MGFGEIALLEWRVVSEAKSVDGVTDDSDEEDDVEYPGCLFAHVISKSLLLMGGGEDD